MSRDIDLEELRAELKGTRPGVFWSDGVACDHGRTKRDCEWCAPRTTESLIDDERVELRGQQIAVAVLRQHDPRETRPRTYFADATAFAVREFGIRRGAAYIAAMDLVHREALIIDAMEYPRRHCGSPEHHRRHTWSDYGVDTPCPGGPSDTSRLRPSGRQVCRKCLNNCIPAVTLAFDNGTRRLHWCSGCTADAEQYRPDADHR